MNQLPRLSRWARWAAPAGVVLAAGGLLAGSALPSAAAAPRLPARSAGQLLAAVRGDAVPPLSGTITETASLGLPALPSGLPSELTGGGPSLLAGSHTIQVWYAGPDHFRLALPQRMSEDDLVRNGTSAWLWDSSANTVTHLTLPAHAPVPPVPAVPLTPQQAARQALARTGPFTAVRVDRNVTVAGQPAYQLVLAPKSASSLIGQVRIAIDSRHHVPLRVQVFARGAGSPAAQVGFTAVSFSRPPAADYGFTPPAGAKVTQQHTRIQQNTGAAAQAGAYQQAGGPASNIRVIGTGWLTVASLPESSLAELSGGAGGGDLLPFRHSASSEGPGSAGPSHPGAAPAGSLLGELLNSAPRVSGSWGSGRLIRTSLLSILVTSTGRVLVGAVTPGVLYRAVTR